MSKRYSRTPEFEKPVRERKHERKKSGKRSHERDKSSRHDEDEDKDSKHHHSSHSDGKRHKRSRSKGAKRRETTPPLRSEQMSSERSPRKDSNSTTVKTATTVSVPPVKPNSSRNRARWDTEEDTNTLGLHSAMQLQAIQLQQQQLLAMQVQVSDKKQRELYVGNLAIGLVTADTLKEFFIGLFNALPDFHRKYATLGPPVTHVQLSGDNKYAFVELKDDALAATAIKFNKTELCGRALNIGRPSGYVASPLQAEPLDISPLTNAGIVPAVGGVTLTNKKQREVYVGNLPIGMVSPQMLKELFTKPMTILPEFDPILGPPVLNVDLGIEGRYAFVEFQSERLATAALGTFQNLQLYGRQLSLGRPAGYLPPGGTVLVGLRDNPGMGAMPGMANMGMSVMPTANGGFSMTPVVPPQLDDVSLTANLVV
eukprot:Platyproteum_vivax@DN1201_c0_g1_i1.p1